MTDTTQHNRTDSVHIVGDYYWRNDRSPIVWIVATASLFAFPPLGGFLMAFAFTSCLYRTPSRGEGDDPVPAGPAADGGRPVDDDDDGYDMRIP